MKKFGIGSRLLALLLALTMIVSMIPLSVFAADGDISSGKTGLDTNIDTLDTISWPIKVYDYLNDGLLFEYASAQDTSVSNIDGDAYGGGEMMPGDFFGGGVLLGNDFTVNSSETNEFYDSLTYSHWLKGESGYNASYAQQGVGTAGAFKFLRLLPYKTYTDMPAMVISDFKNDEEFYSGDESSYPKSRLHYAVLVYQTNVNNLEVTLGVSDSSGDYKIKDYNLNETTGPDSAKVAYDLTESVYLTKNTSTWNYAIVDMATAGAGAKWNNGSAVNQIILDTNMTALDQYLDLAYIAYFAEKAEAQRFAEKGTAFANNPGKFLPDQYYTQTGYSYTAPAATPAFTYGQNYTSSVAFDRQSYLVMNETYGLTTEKKTYTNRYDGQRTYLNVSDNTAGRDYSYVATFSADGKTLPSIDTVDWCVMVYRTHNMTNTTSKSDRIAFWVNATNSDYGHGAYNGDTAKWSNHWADQPFAVSDGEWTYAVFNLAESDIYDYDDGYDYNDIARYFSSMGKIQNIGIYFPGFDSGESMDISHLCFFSTESAATDFGKQALAYVEGENYTYSVSGDGSTYSKHWNMGNNTAFTMLYASSGGGWQNSYTGGTNNWANGYYSYQIGKHTSTGSWANGVNSYRDTAADMGYPVPEDIYFYSVSSKSSHDMSSYDFGYTLYNEITAENYAQVMTAGLLQNDLISVTGVDGKTYRIPEYKQSTVEYIALLVRQTLLIGRQDYYGNYNYNFVQGSVSSQFADAKGNKRDLATALREALGLTLPANGLGNYIPTAAACGGSYELTKSHQELLIGPYSKVVKAFKDRGLTFTFYDAAFYLMHNLFVDDSYNQLQDDYNYLVLSKATVSATGKEAFVFDAGFTTGNGTDDSKSAVQYNEKNGTISLSTAVGKDQIEYSGGQQTTRYPFLPVQDPEGDYRVDTHYNSNGTPYFEEDGANEVTNYGGTYATRDYNYVMQANAEFVYHYQDDLFFQFQGDDDVYLFVNGELVMDIGAAHSVTSVIFSMNEYVLQAQKELSFLKQNYGYRPDISDKKFEDILATAKDAQGEALTEEQKTAYRRWHHLNLVDGESYSIDFYYMERHGWGANMRVATNILMTDPAMDTEKKAYQDGAEINYGGIVDPNELIEYSFSLTNEGQGKLYNLTFNDYDIGLTLSPKTGLSFNQDNINGVRISDARGQKLEASDLIVRVDGYKDEAKTQPVSVNVRFDGQNPNEELKQFLRDLTSNDGTEDDITDDLFSGTGLWRHATVTIRGMYYRLTPQQIADEQFNNTVFTTANPAVDSDLVLNSADTHQVRLIGDARHIYQWASDLEKEENHEVYFTREDLVNWLGGSVKIGSNTYSASQLYMTTCRKDGTTYDFPDTTVRGNTSITVNYLQAGTQLFFIKLFRDTNTDGIPNDLNSDGILDGKDFLVVPLAVYVTDLEDDVVVLDYGLKAELTGKNGITANDYITVPNLDTCYTIMGLMGPKNDAGALQKPVYLSHSQNQSSYNRISFAPVGTNSIACSDGVYEYTEDTVDDKLYFKPTDFMDEEYEIYMAVTIHEDDVNPSKVGTSGNYSINITKEVQMYQKVTVLPATVMYYENDFNGIQFEANQETNYSGTGSNVLIQGVDQSVNYGADQVYQTKDNAQFSGNSMAAIRVTEYGKLAQFTFKGTGFEIISRTNAFDSASFVVTVKKDGTVIKTLPVITEFSNTDASVCRHTNHNVNGHCSICGTYVGHVYYQDVCSKCGQSRQDYYLIGYINGADYGCEGDNANMGQYKFENGKLRATFKTDGYVFIKTTGNASYFMTDGFPGANVNSAYLYNTTSPGLKADKLHVPGGVELTFTLVENNDGTLTLSYTTSDDDVTDLDKTVYFNNTDDWSQVYAYYWSITDATMINWPGISMNPVADEDSVYKMTLPAEAEYVIFNDGSGIQTMDLTVPADNMIYSVSGFNKGWSVYNPGKTTLSFDNTASKWANVNIYYWSEEDEHMVEWPGVAMTPGTDNMFTAAIPSNATKVLFNNGKGPQTADLDILKNGDIYIYGTGWASQGVSDSVRTVYFKNTANWNNLHVHYWDATSEGNLTNWPGDAMVQQQGDVFKAAIPETATHVIFNNGEGGGKQTLNLELVEDRNMFVYDQTAADTLPTGSWRIYGFEDVPEAPSTQKIYLINSGNWSTPYAHYWNDGGDTTAWPGVKMTHVAGNLYSVDVSLATDYIIFNNNSGTQTDNLPLIAGLDTYDFNAKSWGCTDTQTRTVYLDNNTGWATPYAYFWREGVNLGDWPGVQMTQVAGNRYSVEIPAVANRIIFNNNSGDQTKDLNLAVDKDLYNLGADSWSSSGIIEEDTTTRTIYYGNTDGWSKVYIYYWSAANEGMIGWPGVEMSHYEDNDYKAVIPGSAQYVIFNNGEGSQTGNLTIPTNGANFYSVPAASCGEWESYEAMRDLYVDVGTSGWTKVSAYYWSAQGNMVGWPGDAMTNVGGTLYRVTIPASAEMVIFNDGTNQTADLSITGAHDKYSFATGEWSSTTRTIYFESNGTGSVRVTYSSEAVPESKKIMTRVKDSIYSCVIPMDAKYVTFEDGHTVIGPVILSDDHDLYANDEWTVFDPAAEYRNVIYFENTQGWKDVYIHYWGQNINDTVWPGLPMTFVDDRIYTVNIPVGVSGIVINNGKSGGEVRKSVDLTVTPGQNKFTIAEHTGNIVPDLGYEGTWSKYTKTKNDAIHQVPAMRVDGLELGTYTVEIHGMPTYKDNVDWNNKEDFVKTTYLYVDGIRIYQPMGSTNDKYPVSENSAEFVELRNLILKGKAAVASYDHETTAYTGNVSWTENRNGTGGDMKTAYVGNQLSGIDDYLLIGPNNETYLNGNAQTQAVILYVKETESSSHSLQIAARGIDAGLFLGGSSSGVNATLYHGVCIENPDGTIGYGWRPMDTMLSGTEQYYTVDYQDCPYLLDASGAKVYQVALFVRSGMVSFTNVKYIGLDIQSKTIGDATELQLHNGILFVEDEEGGNIGGTENGAQPVLVNNLLSISAQMKATDWIQDEKQSIVLKYPALSFEDEVFYNVFFNTSDLDQEPVEMGLLMFDTLEEEGTIYDAAAVIPGTQKTADGLYVARSLGVQAKDLGKTLYFRIYAQLSNGNYVYSKAASYSVRQYAKTVLEGDHSVEAKALIASMLKYGEAAQNYFGGMETVSDLITDEVSALAANYRTDLMKPVVKPDAFKVGTFAATSTGFVKKYPAVSFEGAFAIHYNFKPSTTVQGNMTLYYWSAKDYESAQTLSADNATGSMIMTPGQEYTAAITDISAKDMDSTYYVAVVYQSNGQTYCSGVLAYSLAAYCNSKAGAEGTIADLAKATAVYGYHAKQYFG